MPLGLLTRPSSVRAPQRRTAGNPRGHHGSQRGCRGFELLLGAEQLGLGRPQVELQNRSQERPTGDLRMEALLAGLTLKPMKPGALPSLSSEDRWC